MIKMTELLLAVAVGFALSDEGDAQEPSSKPPDGSTAQLGALVDGAGAQYALPDPLPRESDAGVGGGVLQALPKPRDLPASLFSPSPSQAPDVLRVDAPYFAPDRLLDIPELQSQGWFGGIELQVVKPHLLSGLSGVVQNRAQRANRISTTVSLPTASLDWTVSPRVFLGYRLPSGFGEFMVAYRNLESDGSGSAAGARGATALRSRLAFNIIDFDYNSRELSLWPNWDMKWTLGIRSLFMFFDSQVNQSFGQAAVGNGIFQARNSNNLAGAGPHIGLETARRIGDSGWSFNFRTDFASVFEGSDVSFFTRSTTLGPNGQPLFGETRHSGTQVAPILSLRLGLTWQPPRYSHSRFFLGYQYERFWALDRLPPTGNNPPSLGQLWDQGLVLQAAFSY